jgi:hypothetical protein
MTAAMSPYLSQINGISVSGNDVFANGADGIVVLGAKT